MLKMETNIKNIVGKTINAVGEDGSNLVIAFADGAFIWLDARNGYDGCDADWCVIDNPEKVIKDIGHLATEIGVTTNQELADYISERDREIEEYRERYDRVQYERLRAKFEKGGA